MPEQSVSRMSSLLVHSDHPLIGVPLEEEGREIVRYFTEDEAAEVATLDHAAQDALSLAGAWSDLDWEEMATEIDRIRHESLPSPPLAL